MDAVGVIPARYSSTRFEGKVLVDIGGKPMLQHVWERAKQARYLDDLIIACDDQRIAQAASEFGAKAVLTAKAHACGTDRICEVVNPLEVRIVINIQADEPLIHPETIDILAQSLLDNKDIPMATVMKKIDNFAEVNDPNVVKVVFDKAGFALYFSRAAIPFRAKNSGVESAAYYKHIGLYAYTKDFLFTYKNIPLSGLEKTECLEQLRVLEDGFKIKLIETKYESVGVDTPEDLEKVKSFIKKL
jgi:3-deoxy-manno-octulosonate cytidylyltransferase (CMP-KDO synthetase)